MEHSNYPRGTFDGGEEAVRSAKRRRLSWLGIVIGTGLILLAPITMLAGMITILAEHPEKQPDGTEKIVSAGPNMLVIIGGILMLIAGLLLLAISAEYLLKTRKVFR